MVSRDHSCPAIPSVRRHPMVGVKFLAVRCACTSFRRLACTTTIEMVAWRNGSRLVASATRALLAA
jgi:hypothetical protein